MERVKILKGKIRSIKKFKMIAIENLRRKQKKGRTKIQKERKIELKRFIRRTGYVEKEQAEDKRNFMSKLD